MLQSALSRATIFARSFPLGKLPARARKPKKQKAAPSPVIQATVRFSSRLALQTTRFFCFFGMFSGARDSSTDDFQGNYGSGQIGH